MGVPVETSTAAAPSPARPALRALARPGRRAAAALAALAALLAVGAAGLLNLRTPAPRPADAPASVFSAERAYAHAKVIAARPHVAGSPANDAVREHLLATLGNLSLTPEYSGAARVGRGSAGMRVEVQDLVAPEAGQLSGGSGGTTLARVRNVVARLPGTDPTGRVFLVAHYDSVQVAPGGNDDAAGTSALLEVARALTSGGTRPRNDIVFVFTDAEEACLCGAAGFVSQHPLAADGGVVLNLEARGSSGPVIMFETSRNNAALVDVFGRAAPHPLGTSFAVEIYRLLPNDTDFTAFLDEGFRGLNAAYIDGAARYHTPLDTVESLDRGSLQQHGDNTLALARAFGDLDLATLQADEDATYFPLPGVLVRYPGSLAGPLALLAVLAVATLAWLARRRGRLTWSRLGVGWALGLVPIVLAPLAAQQLWAAVTALRPGYAAVLDPYRPEWFRLAVVALTAAVLFAWYALARRRVGPAALAVGGLGWLAFFGALLAQAAPGGSYLAALPALAGALGGLVALSVRPDGAWATVAVTAGAAVGVLILAPTVVLLFPALGMATGGAAALLAVWLGLAALPVLDLLLPDADGERKPTDRRLGAVPALAAGLAAVLCAGVGLAVDRFDAEHPVPTHLMYALDAGTGQARWLSGEAEPQPWTAQYVDGPLAAVEEFPALGNRALRSGPAEAATLPAPKVEKVADDRTGDRRTLRLRVVPQRPVRLVSLHVEAGGATVVAATVAGRPVPVESTEGQRWAFGLVFHAPPPEGIEVELVLTGSDGPVSLRAMDASDGLDGLPGFHPRPPDVGIAGSHSSEMLAVARTYEL
ncbi:MAG TPA: M28 family peptidase [Micromonosporaceae bacterium]|nr:M28 family peptidase [Micromonosporaceae bacterium]